MKKQLKDLNINIPRIDVLESRKLFGGNGGYGDPPGGPASGDPSHPYVGEPSGSDPDRYPNTDDELRDRLRDDIWNGVGGSGSLGDQDKDGGDDHNNGKSDYNPDDDRRDDDANDDNDANDHREDNSDWDQDHANNQPNGGGTGNSGGDGGSVGGIGYPFGNDKLSLFQWGGSPDNLSSNSCVTFAINEILEYFNARLTSDIDAEGTKNYLMQHGDFSEDKLNIIGLNLTETISALDLFFDINKLDTKFTINNEQNSVSQTEQDKKDNFNLITNIIEKNHNPVFGMIVVEGRGPHAVVIVGADGNGNYRWFDPGLGTTALSNDPKFYPNGTSLYHAFEITALDRDYLECVERANDGRDQSEHRDPDDSGSDYFG